MGGGHVLQSLKEPLVALAQSQKLVAGDIPLVEPLKMRAFFCAQVGLIALKTKCPDPAAQLESMPLLFNGLFLTGIDDSYLLRGKPITSELADPTSDQLVGSPCAMPNTDPVMAQVWRALPFPRAACSATLTWAGEHAEDLQEAGVSFYDAVIFSLLWTYMAARARVERSFRASSELGAVLEYKDD